MEAVVRSPASLIVLDDNCSPVLAADQEIFELYSELAHGQSESSEREDDQRTVHSGLGFLDSNKAVIQLEFELTAASEPRSPDNGDRPLAGAKSPSTPRNSHGRRLKHAKHVEHAKTFSVQATIAQDLGALRNRKGDTGELSAVNRRVAARVYRDLTVMIFPGGARKRHLEMQILRQRRFVLTGNAIGDHRLFDPAVAAAISVLELGTGTGILPVLLQRSHSLTQGTTKQSQLPLQDAAVFRSWTATDQYDNLKLVRKNLRLNGLEDTPSVNIAELDWLNVRPRRAGDGNEELYDAIVAVDCLYNEALVAPFVRTLDRYAILGKTTVYVLVELRSSDVLELFLESWLSTGQIDSAKGQPYKWTIYRLGEPYVGKDLAVRNGFAAWVGWKVAI